MKTYNLEPLNKIALSTQLDRLHPENLSGCMWADFIREPGKMTDPETGNIYLFATPEQEYKYIEEKRREEKEEEERKAHKYDHIKTPFIDFNNPGRWKEGLNKAKEKGFPVVEMCEDAYYHFLECVFPAIMEGPFYMCGEPYDHDKNGQEIFLCGIEKNGKFYAQYGTKKDYRERKLFK